MTPSLIDRRPRGELVAELYDRHAAGLFAYCHDQLGDTASAANTLVAVLTGVPAIEPPRAALYALARREIYRRDVAYSFPSVDPAADPVTALVERVVREVRPHQREVLLLSAVCGLDTVELAWVLDVAADTAEQLMISARHRFARSLASAVSSARATTPSARLAAEYDVLGVAPAEESLGRLPWRTPAPSLRTRVLAAVPEEPAPDTAKASARAPQQKRWPTTPRWPLPLAEPNPVTNAGVFPAPELTPPAPGRRSKHEATTEPMPRLRGASRPAGKPARASRSRFRATEAPTPSSTHAPSGTADGPGVTSRTTDAPGAPSHPTDVFGAAPHSTDVFGTAPLSPDVFGAASHSTDALSPTSRTTAPSDTTSRSTGVPGTASHVAGEARPSSQSADEPRTSSRPAQERRGASRPDRKRGAPGGEGSLFKNALANGQWPTLQRTFSVGPTSPQEPAEHGLVPSAPARPDLFPSRPAPSRASHGADDLSGGQSPPHPAGADPESRDRPKSPLAAFLAGARNLLRRTKTPASPAPTASPTTPPVPEAWPMGSSTAWPAEPSAPRGAASAPPLPASGATFVAPTAAHDGVPASSQRPFPAVPTTSHVAAASSAPPFPEAPLFPETGPASGAPPLLDLGSAFGAPPFPPGGSASGAPPVFAAPPPAFGAAFSALEAPPAQDGFPAADADADTSFGDGPSTVEMPAISASIPAAHAEAPASTEPAIASTFSPSPEIPAPDAGPAAIGPAPASMTPEPASTNSELPTTDPASTPTKNGSASTASGAASLDSGAVDADGDDPASEAAPASVTATATTSGGVTRPRRHDRLKPIKIGEHHYDWLWELAGFLLCVAIAMLVFFTVPTIVTP
ncbi:RNA polymerase sigma factor [Sphaerisporangium rhizosphaerae]|uniref:RNA polymerase sigma factor 70 region 4 type 2 domain-containing protein n=1 Tax=Sphaerisporangium rhizosphaerae TaxID=2269375 RepID=A0ABW2PGU9_9ACTN